MSSSPDASSSWGKQGGEKTKNEVEKAKKKNLKSKKNPFVASQEGDKTHFCHLDDVQAPDELPSHVELGVGWPVGESFEALPNFLVRENVKAAEGHVVPAQDLHHLLAEA